MVDDRTGGLMKGFTVSHCITLSKGMGIIIPELSLNTPP